MTISLKDLIGPVSGLMTALSQAFPGVPLLAMIAKLLAAAASNPVLLDWLDSLFKHAGPNAVAHAKSSMTPDVASAISAAGMSPDDVCSLIFEALTK